MILILMLITHIYAQDVQVIHMSYYIDDSHSEDITSVYKKKDLFKKFSPNKFNLGFQKSIVWLYVVVKNATDRKTTNYIEFKYPLHDYLDVYKFQNSHISKHYTTGDLTKFNTRKIKTNTFTIPYSLDANETREIFFKIDSQSSLNLEMSFYSNSEYFASLKNGDIILGGYYGAVLIMLLYNLILFFIIKERVYLDYVIFHSSNLFLQLGLNGLAFEYLYPNFPYLNLYYIPITFALATYFTIQFTYSFLKLEKLPYLLNIYLKSLGYLALFVIPLVFVVQYKISISIITLLSAVTVISLFITSFYMLKKHPSASVKFFIIAWSFLFIGVLLEELHNLGLVGSNFITYYGAQIGVFIELTLLSIALAYRYNTLFNKLQKAQVTLTLLNKDMEKKIIQRTKKLDKQNKRLEIENSNNKILLKELYHRVKNNLQIIISLLSFRSSTIIDTEAKEIFEESIQRIQSLAILHEKLYQSENLQIISVKEYIYSLVNELEKSFNNNHDINFIIECNDINLELDVAVSVGLIINELVTNSLKYAFDSTQDEKNISIAMIVEKDTNYLLEVSDNGKGIDKEKLKSGFGFKLLEFLAVYKLKGKIELDESNGLSQKILFPKE